MTKHHKVNITHDEINELPLGSYEGDVEIISGAGELDDVFEEINEHAIVGFDTETKPVFVRGHSNKVALMQIAIPKKVFLIRLNKTGLTTPIVRFLENERILKAGVALRDDIKALQKLKHYHPAGFVELAELSKQAGLEVESVKKLAALLLGFRISKGA